MPSEISRRNIIRQTWLNETYWNQIGFEIKVVFLIGHPGKILDEEVSKFDDILQINFTENHYMLPKKDIAYLDFIRDKCPKAEFAFKGNWVKI